MPNAFPLKSDRTAVIIDDDELLRLMLSMMLKRLGFRVTTGRSGSEALRLVQERPALLLLDYHLPDMTGFAICKAIRGSRIYDDVRVLMMSADEVREANACGDAFLMKPVSQESLTEALRPFFPDLKVG